MVKPNPTFAGKDRSFWAAIKTLSEHLGYSRKGKIVTPSIEDVARGFRELLLDPDLVLTSKGPTPFGLDLVAYIKYRAKVLHEQVEPNLMDAAQARDLFLAQKARLSPTCPIPMNKQKGDKKAEAYLTGLVNMIVESEIGDLDCDYDPRQLTTVTKDRKPLRTLSRRVDGAFPSPINPIAVWEVKEYYYTTTFGSRVADGVYETLLDGVELQELRDSSAIDVEHYLIVDAYKTWWKDGKSYLCRMIDMLHAGYVDEVLFGREVITALPAIVRGWVEKAEALGKEADETAELPGA